MSLHRIARVACPGLLCGLVFCSYAAADAPDLSEVQAFNAYRVLTLGT